MTARTNSAASSASFGDPAGPGSVDLEDDLEDREPLCFPAVWVTFSIADETVGGRTPEERRKAVRRVLYRRCALFWDEMSHFVVIETRSSPREIAIAAREVIAPAVDTVLVRAIETPQACIAGRLRDRDAFVMMPYLEAV